MLLTNSSGNRRRDLVTQPTVELVRGILLSHKVAHVVGANLVPDMVHWSLTCVLLGLFFRDALVGSALEGLQLLDLLFGIPRPLLGLLAFLVAAFLPLGGCLITLLLCLLIDHGLFLHHAVPRSFPGHVIKLGNFKPSSGLLELLLQLGLQRVILN